MEDTSESSCSALHTAETDSEHQTPSQSEANAMETEEQEEHEELDELEEKPMCSADSQKSKKRFTVKKWNAVAMWAWGKL